MASVRNVFFVYRRSSKYLGSTVLRAHQMCEIAQRHITGRYAFHLQPIPGMRLALAQRLWVAVRRPGIYVFVKDAIDRLDPEALAALRRKADGIVVDYVDRPLSRVRLDSVDTHIACSYGAQEALQAAVGGAGRVRLLVHNVDLRLEGLRPEPADRLRLVYFGGPRNTRLSPRAADAVDVVSAELSKDMAENFRRLTAYNAHYCIRPADEAAAAEGVHKPFTKGFLAATLGCPVLVNRQVEDAVRFLGEDYPFLAADASDAAIDAGLARMAEAFGGPDWRAALDIMERVRYRVTPSVIARDLKSILDELG